MSQLRSQATRICGTADRRAIAVARSETPADPEDFLKRGLAILTREHRQLRALRPPRDAATIYESALSASSGELAALEGTIKSLEHQHDPEIALRALQAKLAPLETRSNRAWRSLGIPACAS